MILDDDAFYFSIEKIPGTLQLRVNRRGLIEREEEEEEEERDACNCLVEYGGGKNSSRAEASYHNCRVSVRESVSSLLSSLLLLSLRFRSGLFFLFKGNSYEERGRGAKVNKPVVCVGWERV